ncbi:MAG: DUF1566 domain-containing protein, partial [Deltaproteobacteria bacterium]|nr:DUF1566 domain-containing protein [Deltaproteobacteria bacterium]
PSLDELRTILASSEGTGGTQHSEECYWSPVFNGDCTQSPYWTSTGVDFDNAWVIGFFIGEAYSSPKTSRRYVRCVR